MKKYYEILGLEEGATKAEIEKKYQELSKEYDPKNNDNQDFFKEEYDKIQEAYRELTQNSILSVSGKSVANNNVESEASESSNETSDSITITISTDKIDELKRKKQESRSNSTNERPSMFRAPFSFNGRIRRLEYGLSFLIYFLYEIFLEIVLEETGEVGLYFLLAIPELWFLWAQGAKRCHDRGNSGWYQIIPFYSLWMLFADGDVGDNYYGSNPKGKHS